MQVAFGVEYRRDALKNDTDALLAMAAAVERHSEHPLARAIVRRAREADLAVPEVAGFRALTGAGAEASVDGRRVYIGSPALFENRLNVPLGDLEGKIARLQDDGKTVIVVGDDRTAWGLLALRDTLRPNARQAIAALHGVGIRSVVMLTGDNPRTAHAIAKEAGAATINTDRMWHYTEGVQNWDPIWPDHGIRILPGPSSLWFDARGNRLPAPCLPGFDTLATLKHILSTGYDYSWFVLTQSIIRKEFALSGSEQNPDLASKKWANVLKSRLGGGAPPPVEAFKKHGKDFIVRDNLRDLVAAMNEMTGEALIDHDRLAAQIEARDREIDNPFSKDAQVVALRGARAYRGDRLIRTAKPHRILDPKHGPLIAVKLHILTRKTLGGLHTDLDGRVLDPAGEPIAGLYAAGEVAGFGGGGYHGYNALEGTFLGGCLFSGRNAGRHAAASL